MRGRPNNRGIKSVFNSDRPVPLLSCAVLQVRSEQESGTMNREDELIDLGVASEETLGGEGKMPDLVREIPETGLSDE